MKKKTKIIQKQSIDQIEETKKVKMLFIVFTLAVARSDGVVPFPPTDTLEGWQAREELAVCCMREAETESAQMENWRQHTEEQGATDLENDYDQKSYNYI